jgi:iron complex outermembrane receptor protein
VPPIITGNVALATIFGGNAVTYTSANYPNLDVKPERGVNYNVGAIVATGRFRANLDYYSIKIDDVIRAQASAQIVNALVQTGQTGAGALINCASPLVTQANPTLGGHPFVQLNGPCVQGSSALNSTGAGGIGGLAGGTINFFGGQGTQPALVNGGTLETTGLDFTASYRFEEVVGGTLTTTLDWTRVLTYEASDYIVAGIKVADGFSGVGQFNDTTGRNGQHVARDRGSITFNYRHGRHNLNWTTRYVSKFIDDDPTLYVETNASNANIGTNGVVPTGAACIDTNPVSPPVPAGAGTGLTGANTGATVGFCAGQNVSILAGRKVPATYNTDLSYQAQLPWNTTFTLTVQNVFDKDPAFARLAINYDAFTGSPLGRTIRVGVRKRW